MAPPTTVIVWVTCFSLILFAWWLCALITGRLSMEAIKHIPDVYDPLTSSRCCGSFFLAIIRCIVGFISIGFLLCIILYVQQLTDTAIFFYSYHVWCWILMIIYFIITSFSVICRCLSSKHNAPQNILRVVIWIMYQLQLSMSFNLIIFVCVYVLLHATMRDYPLLQMWDSNKWDLCMILLNFIFIWIDFAMNNIPVKFHYGITIVVISWIYLLSVGNLSNVSLLIYIIWTSVHLGTWIIVYCIAYIKMQYIQKHKKRHNGIKGHRTRTMSTKSANSKMTSKMSPLTPQLSSAKSDILTPVPTSFEPGDVNIPDLFIQKRRHPTIEEEEDEDEDYNTYVVAKMSISSSINSIFTRRFQGVNRGVKVDPLDCKYDEDKEPSKTKKISMSIRSLFTPKPTRDYGDYGMSFHDHIGSLTVVSNVNAFGPLHEFAPTRKASIKFSFMNKTSKIEKELIDTEETYLDGLRVLLNDFILPIFSLGLIDKQYEKQIICNIPQIIHFHEQFLADLRIGPIPKVFNEQSDFFKMYITYICQYEAILDIFARFKNTNKELEQFLKQQRSELNISLCNHLILPIQRIPRYMLLLSELKSNTPAYGNAYKDIDCALNKVTTICNEINEKQKEIENMSQCLQVAETLKHLRINIVVPQRKYIDHFIFKRKNDGRNRQFFVFNDLVIIANLKWEAKRVININKFEAQKSYIDAQGQKHIFIHIMDDATGDKHYTGSIEYISTDDIPQKDRHQNVSNTDVFCSIIHDSRKRWNDNIYIDTKLPK